MVPKDAEMNTVFENSSIRRIIITQNVCVELILYNYGEIFSVIVFKTLDSLSELLDWLFMQ